MFFYIFQVCFTGSKTERPDQPATSVATMGEGRVNDTLDLGDSCFAVCTFSKVYHPNTLATYTAQITVGQPTHTQES